MDLDSVKHISSSYLQHFNLKITQTGLLFTKLKLVWEMISWRRIRGWTKVRAAEPTHVTRGHIESRFWMANNEELNQPVRRAEIWMITNSKYIYILNDKIVRLSQASFEHYGMIDYPNLSYSWLSCCIHLLTIMYLNQWEREILFPWVVPSFLIQLDIG